MITAQLSNRRIEHKGKAPHSQRGDSGDAQSTSGSASMPHSSPNQTSPTVRRTSDVGGSSSSVGLESASVPQDEGPPIPGCSSGPIHTRLDQPGPLRPTQLQPLLIEAEALLGVFETAQKPRRGTLRLLNIVMDNVIALRAKWSSPGEKGTFADIQYDLFPDPFSSLHTFVIRNRP